MQVEGVVYYFHADHLSGTNVVTDQSGNIVARAAYLPYGSLRTVEGTLLRSAI
jgi:hypothetical protein